MKANSQATWNHGLYFALRTLMHFIFASTFIYSIYYDFSFVIIPETHHRMGNSFGGKFKYLTVLNAIIQAIYFTVCFLNDFIGTNEILGAKKLPKIRKIKDNLFATLAFPLALNVGVTFWTLFFIDRELVFPKVFDEFFPSWLNHVLHTNVVVFILLDLCTSFRQYPSKKFGLSVLLVFTALYLIWIHIIKFYSGVWVYPVLEVLDLPQRILFFAVILIFSISLYLLGDFINGKIWTKEMKQIKPTSSKKNK